MLNQTRSFALLDLTKGQKTTILNRKIYSTEICRCGKASHGYCTEIDLLKERSLEVVWKYGPERWRVRPFGTTSARRERVVVCSENQASALEDVTAVDWQIAPVQQQMLRAALLTRSRCIWNKAAHGNFRWFLIYRFLYSNNISISVLRFLHDSYMMRLAFHYPYRYEIASFT